MAQCAGRTQKGDQCRREAREGSAYCSIHQGQEESQAATKSEKSRDDPDFVLKAALGLAALAAIVLFRIRR
jgi:MYXO-CTERM domain-containing protein